MGFRVDLEHLQYFSPRTIQVLAGTWGLHIEHLETTGYPGLQGIDKLPSKNHPAYGTNLIVMTKTLVRRLAPWVPRVKRIVCEMQRAACERELPSICHSEKALIRILFIFGTRPEAIKLCPVIRHMKSRPDDFDVRVCVTAQHRKMLDQVLHAFDVTPDHDLDIMHPGQSLSESTSRIISALDPSSRNRNPASSWSKATLPLPSAAP